MVLNSLKRLQSEFAWNFFTLFEDVSADATKNLALFNIIVSNIHLYFADNKTIDILDVGCGRRYTYTLLLQSIGYKVTGIDTVYANTRELPIKRCVNNLRFNGPKIFCKTVVEEINGSRAKYSKRIYELSGIKLSSNNIDLMKINAEATTFQDESFDLIISIDVFEHLFNLDKVIYEIHRITKRGGLVFLIIDLFASKYGAHWPRYKQTEKIAWQHLLDNNIYVPNNLNRLRENDFIAALTNKFEVIELLRHIDHDTKTFLTADLKGKLDQYAEEELITDRLILVLKK